MGLCFRSHLQTGKDCPVRRRGCIDHSRPGLAVGTELRVSSIPLGSKGAGALKLTLMLIIKTGEYAVLQNGCCQLMGQGCGLTLWECGVMIGEEASRNFRYR